MPHIRGDLHSHTTWSDGRDTTERMVQAARSLGYDYLPSPITRSGLVASRTLTVAECRSSAPMIAAVRAR
jgi:DNA polymerase (family 10)